MLHGFCTYCLNAALHPRYIIVLLTINYKLRPVRIDQRCHSIQYIIARISNEYTFNTEFIEYIERVE